MTQDIDIDCAVILKYYFEFYKLAFLSSLHLLIAFQMGCKQSGSTLIASSVFIFSIFLIWKGFISTLKTNYLIINTRF